MPKKKKMKKEDILDNEKRTQKKEIKASAPYSKNLDSETSGEKKSYEKDYSGIACPAPFFDADNGIVKLSEGSGGKETIRLISKFQSFFYSGKENSMDYSNKKEIIGNNENKNCNKNRYANKTKGKILYAWKNQSNDSATIKISNKYLAFTTDSYIVTPLFFPGGNIGTLAFCGTANDLSMMGAEPIGISLGIVIEEGFPKKDLFEIIKTIGDYSKKYKIPVVTGDTKVMEKGSLDKMIINTSGIGLADFVLDKKIEPGDKIIVSGSIGEHGAALLSKRFELSSGIKTDSKPLWEEINCIKGLIKCAKDITRGGLASALNELLINNENEDAAMPNPDKKQNINEHKNKSTGNMILVYEEKIPLKKEVRGLCEILGIDIYSLASEGRFVCVCNKRNAEKAVKMLSKFDKSASIIGEVLESTGNAVVVKTMFGKRILNMPSGNIVPRIC